MPIYEYQCESCHHIFELFQGFDAPSTAACERCSKEAHRLISRPAVLFKGSGFHVTDYSRSGGGHPSPSETNGKEKGAEAPKPSAAPTSTTPPKSDSAQKA